MIRKNKETELLKHQGIEFLKDWNVLLTKNTRKIYGTASSRLAVIEALLQSGPMSRSALAEQTNLGRSALTEISDALLQAGLLLEVAVVRNSPGKGRPSTLLSVNPERGYFVGIDVGEDPMLMVLTNLAGDILSQHQIPEKNDPQKIAEAIRRGIRHLVSPRERSARPILGLGIALSGLVDHETGVCIHSSALGWHDVPIAAIVRQATGIPTSVDNDANAAAIAEKLFGKAREARNFSVVTLGARIGCAHYIRGRLYRGNDGGAGEISHITVAPGGELCPCGKRGCLNMLAASEEIVEKAKAARLSGSNVRSIEVLAAKGNPQAITILRAAGEALGFALASVIQVNNPELVLVEDIAGFESGLFTVTTRQTIENNILPRFLASTRLFFHHVEPTFLARGAASVAAHKFLFEQMAR